MRNLFILVLIIFIIAGCKSKTTDVPEPVKNPAKSTLVFPAQNEPCTSGTIVSVSKSTIQFKWNKADNTNNYDLILKNLQSGISTTYPASSNTQLDITLDRNTPYSWYIVSKSSTSTTSAQSETWKFYNAGVANVFYAPYPADVMTPALGASVNASSGKISLSWNGTDPDNDIVSYDVYFGTSSTPPLLSANVTKSPLADVAVTTNTLYYWKIITVDAKGNKSDSGLYQFKTN